MTDDALQYLAHRIKLEHRTRVSLLRVHGFKAVGIGLLVLAFGSNRTIEDTVGVWTRSALGASAFAAGVILLATTRDYRDDVTRMRSQLLAVRLLGAWDVAMAVGIVASLVLYDADWMLTWPWEHSPRLQPVPFPLAIYFSLAAMMLRVHSRAIVRVLREQL